METSYLSGINSCFSLDILAQMFYNQCVPAHTGWIIVDPISRAVNFAVSSLHLSDFTRLWRWHRQERPAHLSATPWPPRNICTADCARYSGGARDHTREWIHLFNHGMATAIPANVFYPQTGSHPLPKELSHHVPSFPPRSPYLHHPPLR